MAPEFYREEERYECSREIQHDYLMHYNDDDVEYFASYVASEVNDMEPSKAERVIKKYCNTYHRDYEEELQIINEYREV